jgi:peptide/nickel transport system permease protein
MADAATRFWGAWGARLAIGVVAAIALVAVYAPWIASDVALVWVTAEGVSFPFVADLCNAWNYPAYHDLLFNICSLALPPLVLAGLLLRRRLRLRTRVLGGAALIVLAWIAAMAPWWPAPDGSNRALWRRQAPSGMTHGDLRDLQASWSEWQATPADERGSEPDPLPRWTLFAPIPHRQDRPFAGAILRQAGTVNPASGSRLWLGSDSGGRDVAARMLFGARISLTIGLVATGLALAIGIVIGAISGFAGGIVDLVLQRLTEIMMCFPSFILILVVVAMLGRDIFVIMVVIGLTGWAGVARLVRGEFLAQSVRDYVTAARALGVPAWRVMLIHILPNCLAPVLITASFGVAGAVGTESALSFLGLGDPTAATWGGILEQGRANIHCWWLIWVPGLAVFALVAALNTIGNHLREAIDVRSR